MTAPNMKNPGALAGATGAVVNQQASRTALDTTAGTVPPTRPPTRGEAIAAKCRDCLYDDRASGTWRHQVSACHLTDCPLWRVRPLAGGVPDFIRARDAARLPADWCGLSHETAVGIIAGRIDASPRGCAVEAIGDLTRCGSASPCPEAA
jgi:hypothetical protein